MKTFSSILGCVESEVTFRGSREPLPVDQVTAFEAGQELSQFSIFADEDFNIGGAWFCVNESNGAVYRVSPEYGEGPEFVNSSLEQFKASIEAAARWSAEHDTKTINNDPACIETLELALTDIDGIAMTWPQNEWSSKIDHMRQSVDPSDDESMYFFRTEQ